MSTMITDISAGADDEKAKAAARALLPITNRALIT